jgi:hypothetical protein
MIFNIVVVFLRVQGMTLNVIERLSLTACGLLFFTSLALAAPTSRTTVPPAGFKLCQDENDELVVRTKCKRTETTLNLRSFISLSELAAQRAIEEGGGVEGPQGPEGPPGVVDVANCTTKYSPVVKTGINDWEREVEVTCDPEEFMMTHGFSIIPILTDKAYPTNIEIIFDDTIPIGVQVVAGTPVGKAFGLQATIVCCPR